MSPLLQIPRELRDEILHYLARPGQVFTSRSSPNTQKMHQTRTPEKTYIDTRIYLPSHFPSNILATCKQLRQECFELHYYLLQSDAPAKPVVSDEQPHSNVLAARLGEELSEEAERATHDNSVRITIQVQRTQLGPMGYSIPVREELSPRFMAFLPLLNKVRRLRIVVWPGFDWWNGGVVQPLRGIEKPSSAADSDKRNAASIAIEKILEHLPAVEELRVDVLMHASEGARWDLPENKWESIQSWLDSPVVAKNGQQLKKVTRRLAGVYNRQEPEAFYTQIETRRGNSTTWEVKRNGDMRTVSQALMIDIRSFLLTAVANASSTWWR